MTSAQTLRSRFPILQRSVHGKPIVYLDSAATSQKPDVVLAALERYYREYNSNVHRGVYEIAAEATGAYEEARRRVAAFIHAADEREVVFTRGTTDGLNLVAYGYAAHVLRPGDEIVTTATEHHSNLVPWQQVARRTGAVLRFIDLQPDGSYDVAALKAAVTARTRLVAIAGVSNVLGTINPIAEAAEIAHRASALLVVDGAQSVPHRPTDVAALGVDFLAFSGHKMCGPTGIGALYGRYDLLCETEPFLYGGEMIDHVGLTESSFKEPPLKFEGGTPNIAGAIGLGEACVFLQSIGMEWVARHEEELTAYALERLRTVPGLTIYGPMTARAGAVSFNLEGVHPHDLATALDEDGVCVRAGHHCCQPLMGHLGTMSTARASFYLYNTAADVDALTEALVHAKEFFGHAAV